MYLSADRQTNRQTGGQTDRETDRRTDRLTVTKDLNFRNLHSLKHEILKKSRRVIFFLITIIIIIIFIIHRPHTINDIGLVRYNYYNDYKKKIKIYTYIKRNILNNYKNIYTHTHTHIYIDIPKQDETVLS